MLARAQTAYAIEAPARSRRSFGAGPPAFVMRVTGHTPWRRLLRGGAYRVATAFVNGEIEIDGDMIAAMRWWRAQHAQKLGWMMNVLARLRVESWFQTRKRARRNIQFHYDRSKLFYEQFLDRRMVYSSAYFTSPSMSLDDAQAAKLDRIVSKLDLRPGERFLDVGCGWGALILHAAERCGARAVGCTVSSGQFEFVSEAIRARHLNGRAVVAGCDYRNVQGQFDKIASIGMYEHVGRRRLEAYFAVLARLLKPHGLLLNSGAARPATVRDDAATLFVQRFVFPGGELPYLADVIGAAERAGLEVIDVENLRHHYGLTCASWVERLQAHREQCLALVDAATYRTWLLYLAGAAVSFERGETALYQILLAKRS